MRISLFRNLAFIVFGIFLLNLLASYFSWYTIFPWFDMLMHFLGGAWLALVFSWIFFSYFKQNRWGLGTLLLFVFVGTIAWELLEYFVQYLTQSPESLATFPDSVSDVVCGLVGGFVSGIYTLKTIRS